MVVVFVTVLSVCMCVCVDEDLPEEGRVHLSAVCHLALSAVVKSYRAVISESPWGLTHSPVPDSAFIFCVALLSELPRFTSELI